MWADRLADIDRPRAIDLSSRVHLGDSSTVASTATTADAADRQACTQASCWHCGTVGRTSAVQPGDHATGNSHMAGPAMLCLMYVRSTRLFYLVLFILYGPCHHTTVGLASNRTTWIRSAILFLASDGVHLHSPVESTATLFVEGQRFVFFVVAMFVVWNSVVGARATMRRCRYRRPKPVSPAQ